jgi:hypothetical protein
MNNDDYNPTFDRVETTSHALTLMVEVIRAQASLPHRTWCRNPQYQTVTRPKGRYFHWLSLGKSLGSKPE